MRKIRSQHSLIYILLLTTIFLGCGRNTKKKNIQNSAAATFAKREYLQINNGKPYGILRVECTACKVVYSINNRNSSINIDKGNKDVFFYPKKQSLLKTKIYSNINQKIRLVIIDPNGTVIHNNLNAYHANASAEKKFNITYYRHPNVVLLKSQLKDADF